LAWELGVVERVLGLGIFIGYIEIRRARVCVRAREDWQRL
jgi:hypothetical protein